ncbi:DUF1120 domain-containing protein [Enterobacter asburiae]|uniref:DUF1120 domain-containing protein n=1 Tax=Scandinavium sp. UTDF21-P1B TaxID=3446379 RepID=UPI003488E694
MKYSVKLIAAMVLALAAGNAMAVNDKADVKVTGKIVPPACVPAVAGGAVFDYGVIKAATLKKDDYTKLAAKNLSFTVTCDSSMKVGFKTLDGRAGTGIVNSDGAVMLGLGTFEGKTVGGYDLVMYTGGNISVDGDSNIAGVKSYDDGQTWEQSGIWNKLYFDPRDNFISSVGVHDGSGVPIAFKSLAGKLSIYPVINKGSELELTRVIPLDGQVTIQLVYL